MGVNDAAVVVIDQLTKKYGDFTALDHLSLTLERGHILGFIGPNGAGKTTTIKILVARPGQRAARQASLEPIVLATAVGSSNSWATFQIRSAPTITCACVSTLISLEPPSASSDRPPPSHRGGYGDHGLYLYAGSVRRNLSHGMKQRVGLARTLLHDPQVLILDKPANGLDPQARIEMRDSARPGWHRENLPRH